MQGWWVKVEAALNMAQLCGRAEAQTDRNATTFKWPLVEQGVI